MELPLYERKDRAPLPPKGANVQTTGCAYCAVGCGYKVYTWPVGEEGGPTAKENAFGVDFPTGFESAWVSPNQHTIVSVSGKPHHCVVVPDADATVVNRFVAARLP